MSYKLKTVDLFAGAGGLSHGFMQTKRFDVVAAVEFDMHAAKTYKANHNGVVVLIKDASEISYKTEIEDRFGKIDIVIGGPPCQGFSNANRQKTTLISGNNQLVQQYVRAIKELSPNAFVLENVRTLESEKHFFFVTSENSDEVYALNIPVKKEAINLCDNKYSINILTPLLQSHGIIQDYKMTQDGFSRLSTIYKFCKTEEKAKAYLNKQKKKVLKLLDNWDSYHSDFYSKEWQTFYIDTKLVIRNFMETGNNYTKYFNRIQVLFDIEKTLYRYFELEDNNVTFTLNLTENSIEATVDTFSVKNYLLKIFEFMGYTFDKGILNAASYGAPQLRERFIMIGIKRELLKKSEVSLPKAILEPANYFSVKDAIKDLQQMPVKYSVDDPPIINTTLENTAKLGSLLANSDIIYNHVSTETGEIALERFRHLKPGENFHNLDSTLKSTYSIPERTQNTIYLRLEYDKPSGTVLNARKSMWIHPILDRALSIREAARLQTFPDSFIFYGPKNSQYQQIGNAVPPLLGRAIAECILNLLGYRVRNRLEKILDSEIDQQKLDV